ncbi:restriction endonuclease subunit S [uncultured Chryseobacterium sp.]|uniref:restriction endonuclease subunit S n=1 Tax=uncultured Chryseobacterium sp. TaxID=259322 RepID=UPI002623FF77|nr:restriction endonuclease subunit S [uncultured Chryseobacterium sp.]
MEQTKIPQCYKQTSIGIIPEDWEVKRIDEIAPLQRGFDLPMNNIVSGNHPVVFSNGILKFHNEFKAKAPGIVTGRSGTIGKVFYITEDYWPHNTSLWVTNFIGSKPKYVFYLFNYLNFNRFGSGSGVPTLNRNDVHPYKIPLPPLPEQQKIAEILSTWDKAIETCQKTIEELRLRNKGLAQQLLSGKKRVKGFEETIWKTVKMRNIGKIPKKEAITDIGNHRTLTVRLYAKGVDFNDSVKTVISTSGRPYYVRYKDEILIGRQNIHNGGIGIVNEKQSGNICSNAISSFVVNENNDLKFIFIKLSTPFVYKRIENFMGGTGQKELSENEWLKLEIKIPEKSEQKAISKILDTASSELKHYEEKLQNLKLQKKGLMQQLLTGKVRTV